MPVDMLGIKSMACSDNILKIESTVCVLAGFASKIIYLRPNGFEEALELAPYKGVVAKKALVSADGKHIILSGDYTGGSGFDSSLIMLYKLDIEGQKVIGSGLITGALDRDDLYINGISIDDRQTLFNDSFVVHSKTAGPVQFKIQKVVGLTGVSLSEDDWKKTKLEFRADKLYTFTLSETYGDKESEVQPVPPIPDQKPDTTSWLKWYVIAGIGLVVVATVALVWILIMKVNADSDRPGEGESETKNSAVKSREVYASLIDGDDTMREQDSRL